MKKTLLLITSVLFITSAAFSQSKMNINYLVEYGGKMYKTDNDKPYTGRVFDLYKSNGNKKLEGYYKDGLRNGKWSWWNENGKKKSLGSYLNGDGTDKGDTGISRNGRDGLWSWWYVNGKI